MIREILKTKLMDRLDKRYRNKELVTIGVAVDDLLDIIEKNEEEQKLSMLVAGTD